jgi:hypothetical protein
VTPRAAAGSEKVEGEKGQRLSKLSGLREVYPDIAEEFDKKRAEAEAANPTVDDDANAPQLTWDDFDDEDDEGEDADSVEASSLSSLNTSGHPILVSVPSEGRLLFRLCSFLVGAAKLKRGGGVALPLIYHVYYLCLSMGVIEVWCCIYHKVTGKQAEHRRWIWGWDS